MKKIFIILAILLSTLILNSKTFKLKNCSNFTLLNQRGYLMKSDVYAFAQTKAISNIKTEKVKKTFARRGLFYTNLSPGLLPGIALGYGLINYDEKSYKSQEAIFHLHINSIGLLSTIGGGVLINSFKNPERKGLYFVAHIGMDYTYIADISPGGSTGKSFWKDGSYVPNVSFGSGYSFKIGKTSFLRISLDVGIKYFLTNLNISVVI